MNKQEVIDKIENAIPDFILNDFQRGKETGLTYAFELVKELNEPEKPVLSKEEAEWLEQLKLIANFTHCLYVVTRQGWDYDFEFCAHGKKYKLPCESDGDENELTKYRLVNALIYGYEVEKEKLYTAKFKASNEYLNLDRSYKELYFVKVSKDIAEKCSRYHFTKEKLIECSVWNNPAFEIKEV